MSTVDIEHVWKIYEGDVNAVKDLNLSIGEHEFMAILGPSGSGKSTTLRMIAGLEEITKGDIKFDGKRVNTLTPKERNIALAFESYALYHLMNVYENIAFPLRCRGMSYQEVDKKVRAIADMFNMADILKRRPSNLSGGDQQKVNIARALVREPNITLLDEPISHMDLRVRANMRARIRRLHDELNLTTIYVTHDQEEAISLADRVAVMNEARLQQVGTVDEIWNRPANRFVATFVGEPQMNLIQGRVESPHHVSIQTEEGKKEFKFDGGVDKKYIGSEVTIGIRPQEIGICLQDEAPDTLSALVDVTEFQGEIVICTLQAEDKDNTEIKVVIGPEMTPEHGDRVFIDIKPKVIHLFDQETPILRR